MGRQLKAGHSVAVRAWYATPTWRTAAQHLGAVQRVGAVNHADPTHSTPFHLAISDKRTRRLVFDTIQWFSIVGAFGNAAYSLNRGCSGYL
jgi:hypothetical protein